MPAPAVLLVELGGPAPSVRDFHTAPAVTVGGPPLRVALLDDGAKVAFLAKRGRNPYDGFLFVGRASTSDVVIRDASISKSHAVIEPSPDGWFLKDNRSRNGTSVNGTRLQPGVRVPIASGDLVTFGGYPTYFFTTPELLRLLASTVTLRPPRG